MSEPSQEAKQVEGVDLRPTYEELEAIAADRMDTIMELREAIDDTATAKLREELEQLRTASFHDVSENIARMVTEYVERGIELGTDWRNGLADIIALRLKRVQMDKDKQLAHQQPSAPTADVEKESFAGRTGNNKQKGE